MLIKWRTACQQTMVKSLLHHNSGGTITGAQAGKQTLVLENTGIIETSLYIIIAYYCASNIDVIAIPFKIQ